MQKLISGYTALPQPVRSEQGSALVGAVAFSIILFIASLGYLQVVASSHNYETTGFWDDKAFTAAESGLLLGTKWLSQQQQSNDPEYPFSFIASNPREVYALTSDGIPVSVSIAFSHDTAEIRSIATTGMLTYKKQLSRKVIANPIQAGSYGVYLDNAWNFGGNTKGIRKQDWDGPAHFNTALLLGNPGKGNEDHFNGKVTLYNINPITNQPVTNPTYQSDGHFGNDYRWGVDGGSGNWDEIFQSIYNPNADRIVSVLNTANKTDIVIHTADSSLTFGVNNGNPFYQYKNSAGTTSSVSYNPANDLTLHIANKGVSISGTVKGKVTVYTDAGKNIHIPANLCYDGITSMANWFANPDLAAINQNILGLYSGGNISVAEGNHYITAQIFATNQAGNTLFFENDKKNQTTFSLFGTLAASCYWDPKQGNDQATFNQTWDRRALSAPGLGFERLDENNTIVFNLNRSTWTELNFK
jgi:hypothetical protein